MQRLKVFFVCSGLGRIKRGFESFTQECFDALSEETSLEVFLFKGGGQSRESVKTCWNLPRNDWRTIYLSNLVRKEPYYFEQATFTFNLLPYIQLQQPNVIYFSDGTIGNALWHWKRLTKQKYKLLFSNGGPLSPPFDRWDHIQQVAPIHLQTALDAGLPAEKQSLVPYGLAVPSRFKGLDEGEKLALRRQLNLPENRPVLLSVGVINKSHKRMDYVIREVANLPEPRPYLVLLGQQEAETSEIIQLGYQLLGAKHFQIKTVSYEVVIDYYKVADAFVLASLGEGFGRVYLEAMSYGLPCLTHNHEVSRFVLGELGYLANLEQSGNLSGLIRQILVEETSEVQQQLRHRHVYEKFSWEQLRPNYIKMIQRCVLGNDEVRSSNQTASSVGS